MCSMGFRFCALDTNEHWESHGNHGESKSGLSQSANGGEGCPIEASTVSARRAFGTGRKGFLSGSALPRFCFPPLVYVCDWRNRGDTGCSIACGIAGHASVQGSITSMPASAKSRTLRVTIAMPRERAMAAIGFGHRPSHHPAGGGFLRIGSGGTVEGKNAVGEAGAQHPLQSFRQSVASPPRRHDRKAEAQFRLADRRKVEAGCRTFRDPR